MNEAAKTSVAPGGHSGPPLASTVGQIDGLQVLRAAAVILVAWEHAETLFVMWDGKLLLPDLGVFGIDIFFVVSGFILSYVILKMRQGPGVPAMWRFLERRLVRIYPIYWIFAAIGIVIHVHRHTLQRKLMASMLLLLPLPHYPAFQELSGFTWTLMFEMYFYVVLSLTLLFLVRRKAVTLAIVFLAASVLLGQGINIRRPVLIVIANPMLLEFLYGAFAALALQRWGQRRPWGIGLALLGWAAAIALRMSHVSSPGMGEILSTGAVMPRVLTWGVSAGAIVAGTVLWSPAPRGWLGRLMLACGDASYSIYLSSTLTLTFTCRAMIKVMQHFPPANIGMRFLYQAACLLLTLLAGWLCYQLVEWPMLRKLQRALNLMPDRAPKKLAT